MDRRDKGFTLLELMLVMLLLAGVASLVMLTRPGLNPHRTGDKLALELRSISQRAVLEGRVYAAVVYSNGLRMVELTRNAAQGVQSEIWPGYAWHQVSYLKRRLFFTLPEEISLRLSVENNALMLNPVEASRGEEPQLIFLPGGEKSDFTLGLFYRGEKSGAVIYRHGKTAFVPAGKGDKSP